MEAELKKILKKISENKIEAKLKGAEARKNVENFYSLNAIGKSLLVEFKRINNILNLNNLKINKFESDEF
jgi:hypothetical protein